MAEKYSYKVFQLYAVFITKYGYRQMLFRGLENKNNELWLSKDDCPNYKLIRISEERALYFSDDEERTDTIVNAILGKESDKKGVFLDIHINRDAYDENFEKYDHLNIDVDYAEGIDVRDIFPEIYTAIRHSDNNDEEIKRILDEILKLKRKQLNELPFFKRGYPLMTYGIIALCTIMYIFQIILASKYSEEISFIALGCDYKTFTLGLRQYYRLFTCAFLHGSFLHLFSNMYSLYHAGSGVEKIAGMKKYLSVLIVSILMGSLTQGILAENSIMIGLSGGIYGIIVYLILFLYENHALNFRSIVPIIMINLYINFLSTTAWMAHIGGAVGGVMMYLVYNKQKKLPNVAMLVLVLLFMIVKYVTIKEINPFYKATDLEMVNFYYSIGLKKYGADLLMRLSEVYRKFGG